MKNAAVIGAGIGGLTAAIRLAAAGYKAVVYEAGAKAGGKANEFSMEGFRFDTGPSLLTMPFVADQLFAAVGKKREEYLEFLPLPVICKYFYPSGKILNAYADHDRFSKEIEEKTDDTAQSVRKYFAYCKQIYDTAAPLFLFKPFSEYQTFLNREALKTLLNIGKMDVLRTMHQANASFFTDPDVIQLFDRYATYNGSSPYLAPATLNIIQWVEYGLGGYTVKGGIYRLAEALVRLAEELQVDIQYNSPVQKIVTEGKSVTGVKVNGREERYSLVISNADTGYTFDSLIGEGEHRESRRNRKAGTSTSALVLYAGIKGSFPQLEAHNIFFSSDYQNEFRQLFEENRIPDDPTIYLYTSSRFNQNDAPEGCENWFIMINTPAMRKPIDVETLNRIRHTLISRLSQHLQTDVESLIVSEKIMTPYDLQQNTMSPGGAIYGISSNNRMAAFLRQPNRSKVYRNLYFAGGSAHPGGGIPLVMLSGMITADIILRRES